MNELVVTYDDKLHATAFQKTVGRSVATDACTAAGGRGEELSPGELLGTGLASCMLFSMGILALRDELDISGTHVRVGMDMGEDRIHAINLTFVMPHEYSSTDRSKLEKAASLCPIKRSLLPEVRVSSSFSYPKHVGA